MNNLSLTSIEYELLLRLFDEALVHASKSFSKLLGRNVYVSSLELSEALTFPLEVVYDNSTQYYNLATEVKGELLAQSHLIFSQEDASILMELCFQHRVYSKEDVESLLLEVDNILSASVVSKLADFSGKFMYGYVPSLVYSSISDLQKLIHHQQQWAVTLSLCCQFTVADTSITPIFIWHFSNALIEHLIKQNTSLQTSKNIP